MSWENIKKIYCFSNTMEHSVGKEIQPSIKASKEHEQKAEQEVNTEKN